MTVRAWRRALAVAWSGLGVWGCSDLTATGDGVVLLEVELPTPAVVETSDTLPLTARALDADGNEVQVPVFWRTPDATLDLDTTGFVSTALTSGTGRVQARVGTLTSQLVSLTIRPRSDTVVVAEPDTLDVAATDTASAGLGARVESFNPVGGIAGTTLVYQVVDSAPGPAQAVRFASGGQLFRAATGADGGPAAPVTLRRVPGRVQPAAVRVRVDAFRPSGTVVPGSGQEFLVRFF